MKNKEIKIEIPNGMEIDKENSTFECIKFKPKEKQVKTFDDLDLIYGYYIGSCSGVHSVCSVGAIEKNKNITKSKKHCKSMLAMAQISQLMPFYGGVVTDEEWNNDYLPKYIIERLGNSICHSDYVYSDYHFLAFHTKEQCIDFYENNKQLVKDFFML